MTQSQSKQLTLGALSREDAVKLYSSVRKQSERLAEPLSPEDTVVQSMPDVSPTKWHLGHMTWFFEQVILCNHFKNYKSKTPDFFFIHNSYYDSFGDRVDRSKRGTISRPSLAETMSYRREIDERMKEFLTSVSDDSWNEVNYLLQVGLNHEQQHQELLLTDIKHVLCENPLHPVYRDTAPAYSGIETPAVSFLKFSGGLVEIGANSSDFYYDNEGPRHKAYLNDFNLATRPVTCGEFLEFIEDGGYDNPLLWLSDGWIVKGEQNFRAPLYWKERDGEWFIMTLSGLRKLDPAEPVCHVSYYEAWAFARWAGFRLPTEVEWETASASVDFDPTHSNVIESELFHPRSIDEISDESKLIRMFGDVWEWTGSAYLPYPGYKQVAGPLGEYNGKFMSDQMILRGGSCVTPQSQIRNTYRNFFQCDKRWQFSGFRLAQDN